LTFNKSEVIYISSIYVFYVKIKIVKYLNKPPSIDVTLIGI